MDAPVRIDCGGTDIATLAVALVGAATGLVAVVWQAATFFLSGARFKVELVYGWTGPGLGALVGPPGWSDVGKRPNPGFDRECLGVQVTNVGRLPITITSWSVAIGAARPAHLDSHADVWNKPVPHRLDVGEEATWLVEASLVSQTAYALRNQKDIRVRAHARSAGLKKAKESKQQLRYPEDVGRFLPAPVTKS